MRYEDTITILTPEGVELELTLAGLGSRFVAVLVDTLVKTAVLVGLGLLFAGGAFRTDADEGLLGAVYLVLVFLVLFAYDILFETLASGRTPGKRWTGIRVVRLEGQPVGFLASSVRNILRLVDFLPFGYALGTLAILGTAKNQRLGDMAAGTLVVRERHGAAVADWAARLAAPAVAGAPGWDVSAVTADEVATVRAFLERRFELTDEARARLGATLAERLRPKVAGVPDDLHVEAFLERLAAAKATRG
ncbi:MAG TPA: RDD family protein [Gaiellaceae bacterium]|nr:RDD family protein [Gaiellaceae bacterium]